MKTLKARIGPAVIDALAVLTLAAAVVMIGGCGKKGPPVPPGASRPPNVRDLTYVISQTTIKLSWTIPPPDETAQLPITGFLIYRWQQPQSEKACPNCPIQFNIIGDLPVRGQGSGQFAQAPIMFTQTIEPGNRYIYKVHGYSASGMRSKTSNLVEFTF